jgi:hypothetical protein
VIVLDEQLSGRRLENSIAAWYRGSVVFVTELRPGTIIKDEAVPSLLRRQRHSAFVTIDVDHFWRKIAIDELFCVVCFNVRDQEAHRIPPLLKLLFHNTNFRTKRQRAGHVFRVNIDGKGPFYRHDDQRRGIFSL